jgi:pyrimidine-specific ribonucleoside hydrolase
MSFRSIQHPIPVVIDTDFGGDPDDAIALVYALNCPELDIRAIITSDEYRRNRRALLLRQWLRSANYHIPVFSGRDLENTNLFLLDDLIQDDCDDVPDIFGNRRIETILIELAKCRGHYVSIGGLSNLRYLYETFPNLWRSIRTTIMGGAINYHRAGAIEHNIGLDVESAQLIFESQENMRWILSDRTFVPKLSVSTTHRLYSFFANNKKGFFYSTVHANMDRFFHAFYPDSRMHDPLTVSSLFLPTVKFTAREIAFTPMGEFLPAAHGRSTLVSSSADYDLFWSDVYVKLP